MASPITPSPHRFFFSNGSFEPGQKAIAQTGINRSDDVNQSGPRKLGSSLHHASSPASIYRTSRFAVTPRFPTHRQTHSAQAAASSSIRRDEVEDCDQQISNPVSITSSSSLIRRTRLCDSHEQIEDAYSDFDQDAPTSDPKFHREESEGVYYHASKRRKIPLPPAWPAASMSGSHAVDAGSRGMAISRTTPADIITPERLRRSPIMITSSPNSRSQYQTTVSPGTASSTSPLSLERTAPRFDFGRNIDTANRLVNASNGLQRVTGTSQFILPSESANDNQDSTATLANLNLALLFSPQKYRRYQYAPGGMAATVRDWVLDTAVGASVTETVSSFSIRSIKLGQGGSRSVLGIDKLGEKQRYLLFGDPQDSSVTQIKVGDMIAIMNPTWTIELDHPWTVVVKWKLVGKVPS